MSKILTYKNKITTLDEMGDIVHMERALNMNPNTQKKIKLSQIIIPTNIPNIYSYGDINTTIVKTSKDNGANWDTITLPTGIYTVSLINYAINNAIMSYWTDSTDSGFILRYNTATMICYVDIDSTKLTVASQFQIDFSASDIGELLGFTTTTTIDSDGITSADTYAKVNWFGDNISVELDVGAMLSCVNGVNTKEIASIPLSTSTVGNSYIYPPNGIEMPWINIGNINRFNEYTIKFKSIDGKDVLAFDGEVIFIFELQEII
jgi:hypothetical protein